MDDVETFTVTLRSKRKVEMRELNGLQQVNADMCVPEQAPSSVGVYYRAVMAVVGIDGQPLPASGGRVELEARMQRFSGTEIDDLVREYYNHIRTHIAELPKASAPED